MSHPPEPGPESAPGPARPGLRRRVVVTGAAGFIGAHVCRRLLGMGIDVTGIDNFDPYYDAQVKRRALGEVAGCAGSAAFDFHEADLCDRGAVGALVAGAEGVIHLAGRPGVRASVEDPVACYRANVLGTAAVLAEAARSGVRRVVAASSSSVYGDRAAGPFHEEMDVNEARSPYAASKRACELMAHTHHHLTGVPTAMLRFFTVYGPGQRPDLAISTFLSAARDGRAVRLFGAPTRSRDYTYIDDIVAGVLAAYGAIDRFGFRVWNLGNNRPASLADLVGVIGQVTGRALRTERAEAPQGDVEHTWADLSRARRELGYQPTTDLAQGIAQQWAWMNGRSGVGGA
ncbi:MAG: hypothetical protein C0468_05645 [Planctomyces sp.]|nr:hypothetical protein [Planctomyces sp.]MBA4120439.1 hypothetical protein [Isosphaera sp.]